MDWQRRTLLVPVSKSGKPRTIALNGAAIALLQSVPRVQGSEHIFPSPFSGHPFASLFYPWDRIRRRAGLADVRLHDLRHSFASFLVNQGVSLYVVQGLLGHSQVRMTQRYAHLAPQTLLDAAEVAATGDPERPTGRSRMNLALPPLRSQFGSLLAPRLAWLWRGRRLDGDGHVVARDLAVGTRHLVADVVRPGVVRSRLVEHDLGRGLECLDSPQSCRSSAPPCERSGHPPSVPG